MLWCNFIVIFFYVSYYQALVKVSAVSAEKTDGCTVFLSHQSLNARIITSKSSAVNILYPNEHGEFVRRPIFTLSYMHNYIHL